MRAALVLLLVVALNLLAGSARADTPDGAENAPSVGVWSGGFGTSFRNGEDVPYAYELMYHRLAARYFSAAMGLTLLGTGDGLMYPLPSVAVSLRLGPRGSHHALVTSAALLLFIPRAAIGYEYFGHRLLFRLELSVLGIATARGADWPQVNVTFGRGTR